MKIFKEINTLIHEYPEKEFVGAYNIEDMDEEDKEELGSWEPYGEGEFFKGGYRIIIESKNTR